MDAFTRVCVHVIAICLALYAVVCVIRELIALLPWLAGLSALVLAVRYLWYYTRP